MKRLIGAGLIVLMALFGFSGVSGAATLFTPPLEIDFADSTDVSLVCTVTNVSNKSREITIDIINIDGVSITSVTDMVAPGARLGAVQGSDNGTATPSHCKFDISNGKKSSVRASACIFQTGIGCISALPAS